MKYKIKTNMAYETYKVYVFVSIAYYGEEHVDSEKGLVMLGP